jgi:hypothetical protein
MNWHEEIPEQCPPKGANEANGDEFFRLCKDEPADSSDFCSQKKDNPERKFAGIPECVLYSVSIWGNKEKCLHQKKYPTQKNKKLGKIVLNEDDGQIKNTFKPDHYSWWRSDTFRPDLTVIID